MVDPSPPDFVRLSRKNLVHATVPHTRVRDGSSSSSIFTRISKDPPINAIDDESRDTYPLPGQARPILCTQFPRERSRDNRLQVVHEFTNTPYIECTNWKLLNNVSRLASTRR